MVLNLDIWRAAEHMRKLYGADAAIHAALRADRFMDQGDASGFEAWRRIAAAVNELDRVTHREGEARH